MLTFPKLTSFLVFLCSCCRHAAGHADHGCVETVEEGVDLFPHKVEPLYSQFWSIEYFNTYKILSNTIANVTYLLYLCGTEIPTTDVNISSFAAVVEIPVGKVGITSTPLISFLEQIGARENIGAFLTDPNFVWSPCFAKNLDSGAIAILEEAPATGELPGLVGSDPPNVTKMVTFASIYDTVPFTPVVIVSEFEETTNAAIFEWTKFLSAFFNTEEMADAVVDAAVDRFTCIKENTARSVTDASSRPTLLWGGYSSYCEGWDVGECPNYYCEFAEACSVNILSSTEGTNEAAIEKCFSPHMTTEEFVAFGRDADYWFFPGPNANETLATFAEELSEFKSVQNKQVYDYQGLGQNAWFELRYGEYYNVLEDMCLTLGTEVGVEPRHFWRNVYNDEIPPDGLNGECTNATASNILANEVQTAACKLLADPAPIGSAPTTASPTDADTAKPGEAPPAEAPPTSTSSGHVDVTVSSLRAILVSFMVSLSSAYLF